MQLGRLITKYDKTRCAIVTHLLEVSSTFIGNIIIQGKEKGLHQITTQHKRTEMEIINDFNYFKAHEN